MLKQRAISSAVEHLVYTERVGGSIPSSPTTTGLAAAARIGEDPYMIDRRRLSDLIVPALQLAIEQERLATAEHLLRALEESLTAFGGMDAVERRDVTDEVVALFDGVDALRRKVRMG